MKSILFKVIVRAAILYGCAVWGAEATKRDWADIEHVQKMFVQEELGVSIQIPYLILLAETGLIPLEVEALLITIREVGRIKKMEAGRYPVEVMEESQSRGWMSAVLNWSSRWKITRDDWELPKEKLRELVITRAVDTMWHRDEFFEHTPQLTQYLSEVHDLKEYVVQPYLNDPLSLRLRHEIARMRTGSHRLRIEVGR